MATSKTNPNPPPYPIVASVLPPMPSRPSQELHGGPPPLWELSKSLRRHCRSPSPCSSFGRTTSRLLAATIARCCSKVSETIFPRRCGAIGRNLIENRGPKRRIQPTPVSRHFGPSTPPSGAPPPRPESPLAVCSPISAPD
jgi:hypothetical protein